MRAKKEITENPELLEYVKKQRDVIHKAECRLGSVAQNIRYIENVLTVLETQTDYYSVYAAWDATTNVPQILASRFVNSPRDMQSLFTALDSVGVKLENWTSKTDESNSACIHYTNFDHALHVVVYAYISSTTTCQKRLTGVRIVKEYVTVDREVPTYEYVCPEEDVAQTEPQDENT